VDFAISQLRAGDTLNLRGGTYFESVTASVNGSAGSPILIQSYPGESAVIDSGPSEFRTIGNSDWELVDGSIGEYRSVQSYGGGNIYGYVLGIPGYENERVGLVPYRSGSAFGSTSEDYVDGSTPFYVGPGTFQGSGGRIQIRLAKTQDLRDMEARYGTVFNTDRPDPRHFSIVLSQASRTMSVTGSYLIFKDITFNQALNTIRVESSAHDIAFDSVTVWWGDRGILISGSRDITIQNSRIYNDVPRWIAWSDVKDAPAPADLWRGTAINMENGAHDVRLSYNHIRGGHDGIGINDAEYNLVVDHNRIENFHDDGLELEGTSNVGRIEVYENYIGNCISVIAPGQDTPQFDGPLLVYRNTFALLRNHYVNRKEGINTWNGGGRYGFEYMFKHGSGSSYSTRNTHYYHNTMIMLNTAGKGINITPKYPADTRIANNIMIMVNGRVNGTFRTDSGQVLDGNLYWKVNTVDSDALLSSYDTVPEFNSATGLEANGLGSVPRRGTDPQFATLTLDVVDRSVSEWVLRPDSESFVPSDFFLSAISPAVGAGIVIPAHPTLGTLPDTRNSRDMGAYPLGTSASEYNIFPYVLTPPTPTPPSINVHPSEQSVIEGEAVTFTVGATGSAPLAYQWQRNGSNISGATAASYLISAASLSDNGAQFRCVVSNSEGTATSNAATLTVLTDTTPPSLVSAVGPISTQILVRFSESLEPASAETVSNYTMDQGVSVTGAALSSLDTVILTSSQMTAGVNYTLTVNNVKDFIGNTISANSQASFVYTDLKTTEIRVAAGSDDAEESSSGSMTLTSSDLELVNDGSDQTVGMRFVGVNVPRNAAVLSAYVQFTVDETQSTATSLTIQGETTDNAGGFTTSSQNISSRSRTNASVSWDPAAWNTVGAAEADQRTPDLAAVLQEIFNRPGWASGNALSIIVTGTGHRTADSYDGSPAGAPLLHIEYSGGGTSSDTQPPAPPTGFSFRAK